MSSPFANERALADERPLVGDWKRALDGGVFQDYCSRIGDTPYCVGNYNAGANAPSYQKHVNIGMVVNVSDEDHRPRDKEAFLEADIVYLYEPLLDEAAQSLEACSRAVTAGINAFLKERPEELLLVHCHMGISRSVAVLIRHLMAVGRCSTYEEALGLVKAGRKVAEPNAGFVKQLKAYEGEL